MRLNNAIENDDAEEIFDQLDGLIEAELNREYDIPENMQNFVELTCKRLDVLERRQAESFKQMANVNKKLDTILKKLS